MAAVSRSAVSAARDSLRKRVHRWWPELLLAGVFGPFIIAKHEWGAGALLTVFTLFVWWAGHRHRNPDQATLNDVSVDVRETRELVRTLIAGDDEPEDAPLYLAWSAPTEGSVARRPAGTQGRG